MPETVLLFDLFGVIAHHQSPAGRNRLLDTVAQSCTATGAFWDTYWRLRPRPRVLLPHRPRQAGPGRFPLVPGRARLAAGAE